MYTVFNQPHHNVTRKLKLLCSFRYNMNIHTYFPLWTSKCCTSSWHVIWWGTDILVVKFKMLKLCFLGSADCTGGDIPAVRREKPEVNKWLTASYSNNHTCWHEGSNMRQVEQFQSKDLLMALRSTHQVNHWPMLLWGEDVKWFLLVSSETCLKNTLTSKSVVTRVTLFFLLVFSF